MRIGFDIRPFLRQATGVGVYFRNLLFTLARIDRDNRYYLFSSSFKDRFLQEDLPPFARREFCDCRYPVKLMNFLWQRWGWPPLDRFFRQELDLTHSPIPLVLPTRGRTIVTVHDLFFLDSPSSVEKETRKNFVRRIKESLEKADGILAVSQFVRDQILGRFSVNGEKVRVVYHGVNPGFSARYSDETAEGVRRKYGLPQGFILFVGAIEPRKNLVKLVEALFLIHRASQKIPLVVVGKKGRDYGNLVKKIDELGLDSYVLILDYLPDQDLRVLYRLASCLVFPSLSEGFGIPLIEAMASGLPLVVSRAPALPEIAQDAALYFHPEDAEDMANQVIDVLNDEDRRRSLVERGARQVRNFDWKTTAEKTLEFYRLVVGGRS